MANLLEERITETDAELAIKAKEMIMKALDHSNALTIQLLSTGEEGTESPTLQLSPKLVRMFGELLDAMSREETINLMPHSREMSTQEAAAFLNVSRPFVVKLVDAKKLPAKLVGRHRRIVFGDLMEYKRQMLSKADAAIKDISDMYEDFE